MCLLCRSKQRSARAASTSPIAEKTSSRSRRSSPQPRDRSRRSSRSPPQRSSQRQPSRSPVDRPTSRDVPSRRSNVKYASSLLSELKKSQQAREKVRASEMKELKKQEEREQRDTISIKDSLSPDDDDDDRDRDLVDHRQIPLPPHSDSHPSSGIETADVIMTSQSRVVDLTESNNDVGHLVPAAATKTSSDSRLHNSSKPGNLNNDYKNSPSSSALTHHHQRGADYGSAVTGVEQKVLTKSKSETTRLDRDNSSSRNVKRGGGNSRADTKPESSTVSSEYYVNSDAANSRDDNGTQQQRRRSRERSPEIVRSQLAKLPMPPTPPEQRCLANDKDDSLQRSVVL